MNTSMEYEKAVEILLDYGLNQSGSGGVAAAQVLLSTYNGNAWHVNAVDLCSLDSTGFEAAMSVLYWRVKSFKEPHSIIPNGYDQFDELSKRWIHLSRSQRYGADYINQDIYKYVCPTCGDIQRAYADRENPPWCDSWNDAHNEDDAERVMVKGERVYPA